MPVQLIAAAASIVLAVLIGRRFPRMGLGFAVGAAVLHTAAYCGLRDDAFISFRYAQNLVEGHGLVFNPGERVEGYSNFALVILVSFAHSVLGATIEGAGLAVGWIAVVGVVLAAYRLLVRLDGSPHLATCGAALVAGCSVFAAYGASGLETPLFVALVLLSLIALADRTPCVAGLCAGVATCTRPDGVVVFSALAIAALARGPRRARALVATLTGYGALILPWTIWRVWYYGYLIPNQIEAKRGMELGYQLILGSKYLTRAGMTQLPLLVLGGVVLALVVRCRRRGSALGTVSRADVALGVACLGFLAFPVATGGDWMPAYRFAVPAAVLVGIVIARGLSLARAAGCSAIDGLVCGCAAVGVLVLGAFMPRMLGDVTRMRHVVEGEITLGKWLGRSLPPNTLTASWANGAIPYHSQLPTIDMLGLTDEHIARRGRRHVRGHPGHIAFDSDYVVSRRPSIVTFFGGSGFCATPEEDLVNDRGLFMEYRRDYVTVVFEFTRETNPMGRFASLWVRRDEVERLVPLLVDRSMGIRVVDAR